MLTVSVQNLNGATILKCRGKLVRGEEKTLLCAAVRLNESVILDMSAVDTIDAAGIGLLISLQAAGVYLTLLNPTQQVLRLLLLTGVSSILDIRESTSLEDLFEGRMAQTSVESESAAIPLAG